MAKEKIIIITTDNELSVREMERDSDGSFLAELWDVVGGFIEIVHPIRLEPPYVMICNDEGRVLQLPRNRAASIIYGADEHGCPILGNIAIMKEGYYESEPDIIGLSQGDVNGLVAHFMNSFKFLRGAS